MHEGDSASGGSAPAPAGPPGDSLPPGDPAPGWAHGLLVYLVVAVLAAAAGVGATLAVRHPDRKSVV